MGLIEPLAIAAPLPSGVLLLGSSLSLLGSLAGGRAEHRRHLVGLCAGASSAAAPGPATRPLHRGVSSRSISDPPMRYFSDTWHFSGFSSRSAVLPLQASRAALPAHVPLRGRRAPRRSRWMRTARDTGSSSGRRRCSIRRSGACATSRSTRSAACANSIVEARRFGFSVVAPQPAAEQSTAARSPSTQGKTRRCDVPAAALPRKSVSTRT